MELGVKEDTWSKMNIEEEYLGTKNISNFIFSWNAAKIQFKVFPFYEYLKWNF